MVFSSETFLFLFLPVFLLAYYATPTRLKSLTLLLGSYVFYAWWRLDFLTLLVLTTAWTYVFGLLIARHEGTSRAKLYVGIGVAGCLGVLGIFKYLNFFIDSVAALVGTTPAEMGVAWRLILPIGISFYVFQSISYLIDVYRKDAEPAENPLDFAAFIALFPQLVAGPILRFKDLADQFKERTHTLDKFSEGTLRFGVGLAKKVLLADSVAPLVDLAFKQSDPSFLESWLGAIAYTLQLYFDFSAYSDMAIGIGLMMGFRFIENFDVPYHSKTITEFWRRWHISLSTWLKDYLYIPLGGNRRGKGRTYFNLLTVMVLGGMWHGANWTFILWGTWHGVILAYERLISWPKRADKIWYALPLTMFFVVIGWVMFRADTVGAAFDMYRGMAGFNGFAIKPEIAWQISRESVVMALVGVIVAIVEPQLRTWHVPEAGEISASPSGHAFAVVGTPRLATSVLVTLITAVAMMKLAEQSYSPFLYFQF